MTGIEKLKNAVYNDIIKNKHWNEDKEYTDKFDWIIKRAKHYSNKTGIKWQDILNKWEEDRTYWYMNYYQEANQPEIKGDSVHIFENIGEFRKSVGDKGFRCPYCNGKSISPSLCDSGELVKLANSKTGKKEKCNWSAGGFFGSLGKGVSIFIKEEIELYNIFMPIAWEQE